MTTESIEELTRRVETLEREKRLANLAARVEAMTACVGCQREAGGNWHQETLVKGIMAAILDAGQTLANEVYCIHDQYNARLSGTTEQIAERVNSLFNALTGSHIQSQEPQP